MRERERTESKTVKVKLVVFELILYVYYIAGCFLTLQNNDIIMIHSLVFNARSLKFFSIIDYLVQHIVIPWIMSATYSKNGEHCNCSCYNDNLKLMSDTQLVTIMKKSRTKKDELQMKLQLTSSFVLKT